MTAETQAVLDAARKLSDEERLELVETLGADLDAVEPVFDDEWDAEIARRVKEVEDGTAVLVNWEDLKRRLLAIA